LTAKGGRALPLNVFSLQERRKKKIKKNLEIFQDHFWEWIFAYRWKPCRDCTRLLTTHWNKDCLWSQLCGLCCSYFYFYQVLYVRALKTVCSRGEKVPTFRELEDWYFALESHLN